jgi:nicotinate-nucleotide adenylyltransferase
MNIGVLGGTFDPIHLGHLLVAEEVEANLGLTEVIFVPTGQPWLKVANPISAPISVAAHRVEMVRLAITGRRSFRLSTLEIERKGPSYSVDTMAQLRGQIGAEDKLYFIPRWREPFRLLTMCRLVAVPRPGHLAPDLGKLEAAIPGISQRLIVLDRPQVNISATEIRKLVAGSMSVSHLVPEAVERYIREHELYKKT